MLYIVQLHWFIDFLHPRTSVRMSRHVKAKFRDIKLLTTFGEAVESLGSSHNCAKRRLSVRTDFFTSTCLSFFFLSLSNNLFPTCADQPECTTCQCLLTVKHILGDCFNFNDTRNKHFVAPLWRNYSELQTYITSVHYVSLHRTHTKRKVYVKGVVWGWWWNVQPKRAVFLFFLVPWTDLQLTR